MLDLPSFRSLEEHPQCREIALSFSSLSLYDVTMVLHLKNYIRDAILCLRREGPLEEGKATYSSIFARRIPWTEEPGGLQSIVSQRVGHN